MDIYDLYFLFQFDYISEYIGIIKTFNDIQNIKFIKKPSDKSENSYVYTTKTFDTQDVKYIVKSGDVDLILNEYLVGKTLNNYRHLCDGIIYTIYIFNSNVVPNINKNNNNIIKDLLNKNYKYYSSKNNNVINRLNEIPHIIYEKVQGIEFIEFLHKNHTDSLTQSVLYKNHESTTSTTTEVVFENPQDETTNSPTQSTDNNLQELFDYIISIILTLAFLLEKCGFVHNDLHLNNIILKPYNKIYKLNIHKSTFEIYLKNIPVIIDYGLSHITINNISINTQNFDNYNIHSDVLHYSYDIYKLVLSICHILIKKNINYFNELKWLLKFLISSDDYKKINNINYMKKFLNTEYKQLFSNKNKSKIEINPLNYLYWIINNFNKFSSGNISLNLQVNKNISGSDFNKNKLIDTHKNYLHKIKYFSPIYKIFKLSHISPQSFSKCDTIETYDLKYIEYLQSHNIKYTQISFNYDLLINYLQNKLNMSYNEVNIKTQLNNLLLMLNNDINYITVYEFISLYDKLYYLYFNDIFNFINYNNDYIYDYNDLINLYNYIFREFTTLIINNNDCFIFYLFFSYCKKIYKKLIVPESSLTNFYGVKLQNNSNLSTSYSCIIDCYNNLLNKYYYFNKPSYISPSVNYTLLTIKNSTESKSDLYYLINKHFNISQIDFYNLINKYKNDIDIYNSLKNYTKRVEDSKGQSDGLYKNPTDSLTQSVLYKSLREKEPERLYKNSTYETINNFRVIKRIKEIEKLTHNLFSNNFTKSIKNYLDFGGGDGTITLGISKYFNCVNTYCVDIKNWDDNKPRNYLYSQLKYIDVNTYNPEFIYKNRYAKENPEGFNKNESATPGETGWFYKNSETSTLHNNTLNNHKIHNNSLDLITAFQVFHHILDVSTTLKLLYDLLKPGGYLIIREHDCNNNTTRMLIDVEHIIYDYVYNNLQNSINDYFAYYRTKEQWIDIITNVGFKHIPTNNLNLNKNITNYYFDIFIKT
jgi:SAM-dependent methyltransferase